MTAHDTRDIVLNLILFDLHELDVPLPRSDGRARHILKVLRGAPGDTFAVGLPNGPRGRARLEAVEAEGLVLSFSFDSSPPPLYPVTLVVGFPRPQSARRILREATAQGVAQMYFVGTTLGEKSYRQSPLWTTDEYQRHLRLGAEQAHCTHLPDVQCFYNLEKGLAALLPATDRIALDNVVPARHLNEWTPAQLHTVLAVGSERGWTDRERDLLTAHGFMLAHIGPRALRTETACVAGLSLILAKTAGTP